MSDNQAFDLMGCLRGLDNRLKELENAKNFRNDTGVEDWKPRFTIADRDAKIKGLETAFAVQSEHYQKEMDKAREKIAKLEFELSGAIANLNSYRTMSFKFQEESQLKDKVIAELKKANSDLAGAAIKKEPQPELKEKGNGFKKYRGMWGNEYFSCNFCVKTYYDIEKMKTHIRECHQDEK